MEEIDIAFRGRTEPYSYEFLSLFGAKNLKLSLIGVSNSLDAVEQYCKKTNFYGRNIIEIVFSPYSSDQIECLVM